jgi:hypothetical protein
MLKAHYQQAQLLAWRMKLWGKLWDEIEIYIKAQHLPERVTESIFSAALGRKLRNAQYRKSADVSNNLASRDFKMLVNRGLLEATGSNRGRYYKASPMLVAMRGRVWEPFKPGDPFEVEEAAAAYLPGMHP